MKCTNIKIHGDPVDFPMSKAAHSNLGETLVTLIADNSWTSEFTVDAHFPDGQAYLIINHPAFSEQHQIVIRDDGTAWSLSRVKEFVTERLQGFEISLEPGIRALKSQQKVWQKLQRKIQTAKAGAENCPGAHLATEHNLHTLFTTEGAGPS